MSDKPPISERGAWSLAWQRFRHHKLAMASAALLIVLAVLSAVAPLFEIMFGIDASRVDLLHRFTLPTTDAWLGRDELGRDVFVRMLYGGQVSLLVGAVTAIAAAVIGTMVGLAAAYRGGWLDALLMRFTDAVIALPFLPLLIVLAAIDLNKLGIPPALINSELISLYRIIFIVALVGWTTSARLVRGAALSIRERDFVLAARAQGASAWRIMGVHILPNLVSPIIVATTLSAGKIILLESVLSFLGLGIQPPVASWGNQLTNAQELIYSAPQLAFFPGIAIFVTVIAFNFLGDGLQDALDPKSVSHASTGR
ncbi:MAG: ABC transporter permease [Rhodospirillaceae bacterium]|jgi:peptide/nickel transport system permease protein|nr:ABC transporter permease [Rhodospirillaceae bacterium]MBT3885757.1 ABC transporter permease [Rhodospirillaceae bacterium]MBT4118546.1 ABC transporter permease [Rhodospirillaceae bacterium]MBT4672680.1 ABC transporter permease [Rhodospirillaceae bacterium]MBT4718606.1 ABC transporter permease [Rhodospirillaceae bacterium]